MQQYSRALHKVDQDRQTAERQVIQEYPHDPDGSGIMESIMLSICSIIACGNRATC